MIRYFFDQDNDSHWYLIPVERREAWNRWLDLDPDAEEAWDAPEWARPLGGGVSAISFTEPFPNV